MVCKEGLPHDQTHDDALARLEDELRTSRTQAWDVETFLANRHRAKIEKLQPEEGPTWASRWAAVKDALWELSALFGLLLFHILVGVWLLSGEFPIHVHTDKEEYALRLVHEGLLLPPPAPPARYRVGQVPVTAPAPAP